MQGLGNRLWRLTEKAACKVFGIFFRFLGREPSEQGQAAFLQFVRFGLVGLSNTAVSYVLYLLSLLLFRKLGIWEGTDYLIAQLIAFLLSVLWSYFWNSRKVFVQKEEEKRSVWRTLLKTYISYSFTGLFLNSILLLLWVQILHVSEFLAPVINLLISVPLNFLISKFWAFK